MARDCTADRVLLSEHMAAHWTKIGYKPDAEADHEVDEVPELEVQVGQTKKDVQVSSEGSKLTAKYRSVIVKGFSPKMSMDTVFQTLLEHGLPSNYDKNSLNKNETTGVLTLSDLVPDQCLAIIEKMHGKKFFGKKIFVTSVVSNSPVKQSTPPVSEHSTAQTQLVESSDSESQISKPSVAASTQSPSVESGPGKLTFSLYTPSSPILDPNVSSAKGASTEFLHESPLVSNTDEFSFGPPLQAKATGLAEMFELPNKRKASVSPQSTEESRKDKKAAKKVQRSQLKLQNKSKLQLNVTPPKA